MNDEAAAKPHIALIEDNPSDVFLIKLALERSGLASEMTNYKNGADALLALLPAAGAPGVPPAPDLILLDLNTPRSDGFEVLAAIRNDARLSHVPVAILTSSASPADKRRAMSNGATEFIQKPTELDAFVEAVGGAVKRMLAAGGSRSPR